MSTTAMMLLIFGLMVILVLVVASGLRARRQTPPESMRPTRFSLTFDNSGFSVVGLPTFSTDNFQMTWAEVWQVSFYNDDLFMDFVYCLSFARADGTGIKLDEDMAGWESFCEALPRFLPGCPTPTHLTKPAPPLSPDVAIIYTCAPASQGVNHLSVDV